ncbi:MAG: hypothetical protein IJV43_03750, partial [Oscillospiraceae bacterium]|nr:hypothetical protein [Oscillospiraceae bacterium]
MIFFERDGFLETVSFFFLQKKEMVSSFRRKKRRSCISTRSAGVSGAPRRYGLPRFPLAAAFSLVEALRLDLLAPALGGLT